MTGRRPRLTYANVISTLALFLALGGVSYAAVTLPAKSVGTRELKNKAVTPSKVAPDTIQLFRGKRGFRGFRGATGAGGATGAAGPAGPTGATGATGPAGTTGAAGRSALTVLQTGETVRGVVGYIGTAAGMGDLFGGYMTLPIPAPVDLDNAHVTVDGQDEASGECTGTYASPTAKAGYVCIYPANTSNATAINGYVPFGVPTKYGFAVQAQSAATGFSWVQATWAYTAP